MSPALIVPSVPTLFLYVASLGVVLWTVLDVSRRSSNVLPPRRKAAWIIGAAIGWLLFGIVGAFVAIVYLVGPRRRMNAPLR